MPSSSLRIGVDVGGTNTDAVIMSGREVLAAHKTPTTADIGSGIRSTLLELLRQAQVPAGHISAVMIGTTHFTNSFVQARSLAPVGVIRLAAPSSTSLPPFVDWPERLRRAVRGYAVITRGGYNYDGSEIATPDPVEIRRLAEAIHAAGIGAVAISSVFAPVNDAQEQLAARIVREVAPDMKITLSSELGRIGLIERENAATMNAALAEMAVDVVQSFGKSLAALGIHCPFYVSQNDGTLMSPEQAMRYPVLTFASGPTNSIRGAGLLSGLTDCIVVDIGGTTTDVGVLSGGFPRESAVAVDIGGVKTNFRMPDVLSIGLGGGSRVRYEAGEVTVGPDSVGFRLLEEARVFGGRTLTASDIAVAAGKARMGDFRAVSDMDPTLVDNALRTMKAMIEDAVDRMKSSAQNVPVVLVGGASMLAHRDIRGVSEVVVPERASVANAIGAAIAQVSGEIDQVYSYERDGREVSLARAKVAATEKARVAGAEMGTIQIADVEELPLQYLSGGAVRVRVKAVGELAIEESA